MVGRLLSFRVSADFQVLKPVSFREGICQTYGYPNLKNTAGNVERCSWQSTSHLWLPSWIPREPQHTPVSQTQKGIPKPPNDSGIPKHNLLVGGSFWVCSFRDMLGFPKRLGPLSFWCSLGNLQAKRYAFTTFELCNGFLQWIKQHIFINILQPREKSF